MAWESIPAIIDFIDGLFGGGDGDNTEAIFDGLQQVVNILIKETRSQHDSIEEAIGRALGKTINDLGNIVIGSRETINRTIADEVSRGAYQVADTVQKQNQALEDFIRKSDGLIMESNVGIQRALGDVIGGIGSIIQTLGDGIDVIVNNEVVLTEEVIGGVTRQVAGLIEDQSNAFAVVTGTFQDTLGDVFDVWLKTEQLEADATQLALMEIVKAILRSGDFLDGSNDLFKQWAEGNFIEDTFGHVFDVLTEPLQRIGDEAIGQIRVIADDLATSNLDVQVCGQDIIDSLPDDPILRLIVGGIVHAVTLAIVPLALAQQRAQPCLQADAFSNPWNILQPGDVASAKHYGLVDTEWAVGELRRNGFSIERSELLLDISKEIPDITFLFSAWFRNILSDDGLDRSLAARGFNEDFSSMLKQIAFFIPPVQDLITMAVREVFSPEIAEANGQFEDFPEDFADWAKQQGVSRQWAENYWAAHWALPSVMQGYEMLHRRVITEDQLKGLMRSLDIMPAWRDRLIDISYAPYTRVDVRRMHALGILNEQQVYEAYLDLGYNQERAQNMTRFTLEYNSDDNSPDDPVVTDLTRANILEFYRREIISESQARTFLIDAGVNEAAANLWLSNENLKAELKERDDDIDLILESYKVDALSFDRAQDALNGLVRERRELAEAMLELRKMQIQKTKVPGIKDLGEFLSNGLITDDEFTEVLETKGYSSSWAGKYLQLAKLGALGNEG